MKKKFILLPFVALLGYVVFSSYSSGPGYSSIEGTGVTGTGCSCHNATATSSTTVSVQLYDAAGATLLSNYVAGGSYKIRVTGTQTSSSFTLPKFGFQVSAMVGTSTSSNAGTMTAPSGTHTVSVFGVNLVEHSSALTATTGSGGSGTTYVVNIPWTAPAAGTGNVTLRSVINAVNNDGGYGSGTEDKWNTGSAVMPELGAITGTATTCVGSSTTLSNSITGGGTWSTTSPNISLSSSTSSSTIVTGVSAGTGTVTFTAGGNFVTKVITVSSGPSSTISGSTTVCQTQTTILTNTTPGGTWSSASSNVSVTGTGGVTGINAGTAVVSYTVSGCSVTTTVNVSPLALITGSLNACEGATTALANANSGGTWSSSVSTVGTISPSGVVTGLVAGTTNISYALSSGCTAVSTVTVNTQPPAIGGPNTVCIGSTITATNSAAGSWSSSTAGPGSVNINASTGAISTAVAGTTTITYTATGGCFATELITVNPLPNPILGGFSPFCANTTITLTSTTSGGTWSIGSPSVASISTGGLVTPVSPAGGTSTVSYTLSTGCKRGTTITILPISPVSGLLNVCTGLTTSLSSGPSGGTWASGTTAVGTISSSGVVAGIGAGTTIVTYTSGTCSATATVTVGALSPITGGGSVCVGSTLSLSDATTGGTWSSSSPSVGTIDVSSGLFTALTSGTSTVVYTTGAGCSTSTVITVNALPGAVTVSGGGAFCSNATITASGGAGGAIYFQGTTSGGISTATPSVSQLVTSSGIYYFRAQTALGCWGTEGNVVVTINPTPAAITGPSFVCTGSVITLNSTTTGGTWSASNTNVAIGSSPGEVTGIVVGTSNITYTITSTGCFTTRIITVNPLPDDYTLNSLCEGGSVSLSTTPSSGTWISSNTSVATIGVTSGVVSALTAGTSNITYTISTGCSLVKVLSVMVMPSSVTGIAVICENTTTTLNATPAIGTWSSSTPFAATVNPASGVVTGQHAGTTTITYTLLNGCATSRVVTVNAMPAPLAGLIAVCVGGTASLSTSAFTYSSSDPAIFTINSSGLLTGVSAGTASLTYTSIASGCYNTKTVTVNTTPSAITGAVPVCIASSITLSSSPATGTWSSPSSSVTVGSSSGSVTGVSAGIATISYTLGNGCGAATTVTINPLPSAILGGLAICQGFNTTLSSSPTTGTWTSSSPSVAIIGSGSGVVTGSGIGTSTISYTLPATGCARAAVVSVNAVPASITGTTTTCVGNTTTLSTTSTGGSWTSASGSIATVGSSSGIVTGVAAGTTTITYSFATTCFTTTIVSVSPATSAGTISGSSGVCTGSTITLVDGAPGGAWSASNSNATVSSSGLVTGVTAGTTTISYTVTSGCGTVSATKIVTVTTSATAGTISGPTSICMGATGTLSSSVTGGTWVSSNTSVAPIGSSSGIVSGLIASGTANITYTINSSCGTASTTVSVFVNPPPSPIVGGTFCEGATVALPVTSGTWASSNSAIATVDVSGLMTGIAAGTTTLTYTETSTGCFNTHTATVIAAPGPISGTTFTCTGSSVTLTDLTTGGTWSSSTTSVAIIGSASGTITPLTSGTTTISYTKSGCSRTTVFTVNATPASISGLAGVCIGNDITLSNTLTGGTWGSGNAAVGTIDATTGVFTGISAGTSVITYMMPTGCKRTGIATVNALPSSISGTTVMCVGGTTALTDAPAGGVWSSDNVGIATIGSSSGVVTGISTGTTMITYTAPVTGCTRGIAVSVNPLPAAITSGGAICVGSSLTLADGSSGGNWISAATTIATVNITTGEVTGIAAGTATISYSLLTGCNATTVITVNALPSTFTGTMAACAGGTTTLGSTPIGGTWASGTPANATIDPASGVVTGVVAGTSAITYTAPVTGCMRIAAITVNPLPSAITGLLTICSGNTSSLSSAPGGGTWISGNASIATVGVTTGIVSGVASGTASITYTLSTTCATTATVTVNPTPSITGVASACVGATTTLAGTITGGTWSSGTTTVATVGSSSGVVTGVSAGTSVVTYALPTGCTSAVVVTINPLTSAGTITGGSSVCVGATITLGESVTGGVWSATNGHATITTAGVVSGVVAGIDTVQYTVTGICGTVAASYVITVNPLPTAGAITGSGIACPGTITTLTDGVSGGTWSSASASIATVGSSSGIVTGVAAGTAVITYTVTNDCGTAHASTIVTVLPAVDAGTISGVDTVCQGNTITLTVTGSGGTWLSSAAATATVSTAGVVTGVAPGTVTILYIVANACSLDTATHTVTVRSVLACTSKVDPVRPGSDGLKVYPNPNGGSFTVDLPMVNDDMTITIQDMLGKTIETKTVTNHAHTITFNLINIAAGSYMVRVTAGDHVYREKVVIW